MVPGRLPQIEQLVATRRQPGKPFAAVNSFLPEVEYRLTILSVYFPSGRGETSDQLWPLPPPLGPAGLVDEDVAIEVLADFFAFPGGVVACPGVAALPVGVAMVDDVLAGLGPVDFVGGFALPVGFALPGGVLVGAALGNAAGVDPPCEGIGATCADGDRGEVG